MEEYRIANEWMEDIMNGKRKADDAPKMVQDWFMLTIYNIAKRVVERPTKQGRINALNDVKSYAPAFYDDVKRVAKEIYKTGHTT